MEYMGYLKMVKRVWDPLPEGLKEKIRIGTYRILKKPLITEVQKLPITGSGISDDGFPWVSLSNGYKFYDFLPSSNDRVLYKLYLSPGGILRDGSPIWGRPVSLLKEKGYETVKGNKGGVFAWKEKRHNN